MGSDALTRFHEKNASEASEEPLFVRQTSKKTILKNIRLESDSEQDDDSDELDDIPLFQRARIRARVRRRKRAISSSPETDVPTISVISPLTSYSLEKESFLLKSGDSRKTKVSKISSNSDVHHDPTSGKEDKDIKPPVKIPGNEGLLIQEPNKPALPDIDQTTPPATPKVITTPSADSERANTPILTKQSLLQKAIESQSRDTEVVVSNNASRPSGAVSAQQDMLPSRKLSLDQRDNDQNASQDRSKNCE